MSETKKKAFAAAILTSAFLLMRCTPATTVAGGGTDVSNPKIVGTIVLPSGSPSPHTLVQMIPADYDPVAMGRIPDSLTDTTDANGEFRCNASVRGMYNIQAVNLDNRMRILIRNVSANAVNDTIGADTLRLPATVKVTVPPGADSARGYFYVAGTTSYGFINPGSGVAIMDSLPDQTLPALYYSEQNNPSASRIVRDSVTVSGNDTALVFNSALRYYKTVFFNTTPSGANVAADVSNVPVLVRLTEKNFVFDRAQPGGSDIAFAKRDGTPLAFEIEQWDQTGKTASIWVKIDTIFGNSDTQSILMFWGVSPSSLQGATISSSNGQAVFDTGNGFQGVWHCAEAGSMPALDATANRFDGTPVGMSAASAVAGAIGNARQFDGASSYLEMAGTAGGKLSFPEHGVYTVSAWVYADTLDSTYHPIVEKGDFQYSLQVRNLNTWEFVEYESAQQWESSSFAAASRAWYYLVAVRNGASQYLYVNGSLADSTVELKNYSQPRSTATDLTIGYGKRIGTIDTWFKGAIDEARIESAARGADWIRLNYMNQRQNDALIVFR